MTLERKIILISEKRTTLANIISAFIMLETQFNIQGERIYKVYTNTYVGRKVTRVSPFYIQRPA